MGNGLTRAAAPAGPPASPRSMRRFAALICVAVVLAGTAGCSLAAQNAADSTSESSAPTATPVAQSSDPGCVDAVKAVSTYGPTTIKYATEAKRDLDKAEIHVLVVALDLAADAAHAPQAKQSIQTLANAYLAFEDAWTSLAAPPLSSVLADTSSLESVCG